MQETQMLNIVYEDDYLLVINKPAGLQSAAEPTAYPSVEKAAESYLKSTYPWKKQLITGIVHQLDRPVSGVMLMAKTPLALKHLNLQFEHRTVRKEYLAYVEGEMPQMSGELQHWLKKDPSERRAVIAAAEAERAQKAHLLFKVLESSAGKSLVKVELLTGRYHQIRAQFGGIGCPIIGDKKYGSAWDGGDQICLHANSLAIKHPKTGDLKIFEATLERTGTWTV